MKKNLEGVGEVSVPSTFKEKLQNFWYHYKLHAIALVLVVAIIIVCVTQLMGKEIYDSYILYAGSKNIGRTSQDGDVAEIVTVISSLKKISKDYDENGEVSINFTNYYYMSADEMSKATDVNDALLASDKKALASTLEHSEYYLIFISMAVYEQYKDVADGTMFIPLGDFIGEDDTIELYSDNAILLSSTDYYSLPGISALPSDTLVCIRRPSMLATKSEEHMTLFENAKEMLSAIINYKL